MAELGEDKWARWVLRPSTTTPEGRRRVLDFLIPVRDRVLGNARISAGDTVLDVGTGDGLIAFGALDRFGASGRIILSDISEELLAHARDLARQMEVVDRCEFLCVSADDLAPLRDDSVDVVTTRSVLIYLPRDRKRQAIREFHRVAKPGGRISLFEPINRFANPEPSHLLRGLDVTTIMDAADKVRAAYERAQPAATHPLLDFDERDLLGWVEEAGFKEIHLDYEVEIEPGSLWPTDWKSFVTTSGNPLEPTLEQIMSEDLTSEEAGRLASHLRPLVESRSGVKRLAVAYLWAVKD